MVTADEKLKEKSEELFRGHGYDFFHTIGPKEAKELLLIVNINIVVFYIIPGQEDLITDVVNGEYPQIPHYVGVAQDIPSLKNAMKIKLGRTFLKSTRLPQLAVYVHKLFENNEDDIDEDELALMNQG